MVPENVYFCSHQPPATLLNRPITQNLFNDASPPGAATWCTQGVVCEVAGKGFGKYNCENPHARDFQKLCPSNICNHIPLGIKASKSACELW